MPVGKGLGSRSMKRGLMSLVNILAGAALLSLMTLANGRPSIFTDTKAYYVLGSQIGAKLGLATPGQSAADLVGGATKQGEGAAPAAQSVQERMSLALTVAGSRSPFYSFVLAALANAGTFWLVVAVQATVSAWLLWTLAK